MRWIHRSINYQTLQGSVIMSDHAHSIMEMNTITQPKPAYIDEHFEGDAYKASTTFRFLTKKQLHHSGFARLLRELRSTAEDRGLDEIVVEIDALIERNEAKSRGFAVAAHEVFDRALTPEMS
jgi:hypothetical protein